MKVNRTQIAACILIAVGSFSTISNAAESELLLSGSVESVDSKASTITVVGHQIKVRDASVYLLGSKINAFGSLNARGDAKVAIVQRTNSYAASGDAVVVVGKVTNVDSSRGRVSVGGASIDYTALLSRSSFALPSVGDSIRVVGTQPAGKGTILARAMTAASGVTGSSLRSQGVTGSSQALGVTGSSLLHALGVTGSSQAVGVTGSSLLRAQGVTGSSQAVGVTGSSRAVGVTGSSLLRAQGVTGSSQAVGVTGSSRAVGVTGSSLLRAQGVTGSSQGASPGVAGLWASRAAAC